MKRTGWKVQSRVALAACAAMLVAALPAKATPDLIAVGQAGGDGVLVLDSLPDQDGLGDALLAARLRAAPVTRLSDTDAPVSRIVSLTLTLDAKAPDTAQIGGQSVALSDLPERVVALGAGDAAIRAALVSVIGAEGAGVAMAGQLAQALTAAGVPLVALQGVASTDCTMGAVARDLSGGVADAAPFGDGDGTTTVAEADRYAAAALRRATDRAGDCAPAFALTVAAEPDAALWTVTPDTDLRPALAAERFEAGFLMSSNDVDAITGFLASCRYCPVEDRLRTRRDRIVAQARLASVESDIWDRIKNDTRPERFSVYLDTCTFCLHREEAEARVARLGTGDAARPVPETGPGQTTSDDATAQASGMLGDSEAEALQSALESGDPVLIQSYLDSCTVCDGKDELTRALRAAHELTALRMPCLTAAAVPQLGGPRKLDDIDIDAAMPACRAVLRAFPGDALTETMLGRVAQAAGDTGRAEAAYATGMTAKIPAAYGLAAYLLFSEGSGDATAAEALALQGAKRGDWLSRELLTTLYSRELIPGKGHAEAFEIAQSLADEGDTLAQFFVGYYYLEGMGVAASPEKAAYWLDKAVGKGYTPANAYLADLLEAGRGVDAAPRRAAELYWDGMRQGDEMAVTRIVEELNRRDREVVREIQSRLRDASLYTGQIDGIVGRGTRRAIRQFADSLPGNG